MTDQTALIIMAAPLPPESFINLLKTQFASSDYKIEFETDRARASANGIDWTLYSDEMRIVQHRSGAGRERRHDVSGHDAKPVE